MASSEVLTKYFESDQRAAKVFGVGLGGEIYLRRPFTPPFSTDPRV